MHIDKTMEDYLRQCLDKGINTHVLEVALTVDNQIALRMMPIQPPTQQALDQMHREIKELARNNYAEFERQKNLSRSERLRDEEKMLESMGMPLTPSVRRIEYKRKQRRTDGEYKSPTAGFM